MPRPNAPKKPKLTPWELHVLGTAYESFRRQPFGYRHGVMAAQIVSDVWDGLFTRDEVRSLVKKKKIVFEIPVGRGHNGVSTVTWELTAYGLELFRWWFEMEATRARAA